MKKTNKYYDCCECGKKVRVNSLRFYNGKEYCYHCYIHVAKVFYETKSVDEYFVYEFQTGFTLKQRNFILKNKGKMTRCEYIRHLLNKEMKVK